MCYKTDEKLFYYLGGYNCDLRKEKSRKNMYCISFISLKRKLQRNNLRKLFKAVAITALIYGSEGWIL